MAKLKHKKLPEAFEANFETCSNVHSHFTRSIKSQNFYQRSHSKLASSRSITISGVKIWNSLSPDLRKNSARFCFI